MATFLLVLGLLAAMAAVGADALQKYTRQQFVPRQAIFLAMGAAYVLGILGSLVWMFTVSIPRPLALLLGLAGIGGLSWVLWDKLRHELPQFTREDDGDRSDEAPYQATPNPARRSRSAGDGEPDEPEGGWGDYPQPEPVVIVGDDPRPTEKTGRRGDNA